MKINKEKLSNVFWVIVAIAVMVAVAYSFLTNPVEHIEDRNGEKQEVSVVIEMKDDEISSISIDETYTQDGERTTKKRLGASYGMKDVEGSKGEWNEQIKHLEALLNSFKEDELPKTHEEFENKAILYHILMDLEDFLLRKQKFVQGISDKQKELYWNK